MNILVLIPRLRRLEYACFGEGDRKPLLESYLSPFIYDRVTLRGALGRIKADCLTFTDGPLDRVIIRSPYGGNTFMRTTRVDAKMLVSLAGLSADAPVHIPMVHLLAQISLQVFPGASVSMAFDTAFFVDLPDRERRYGIADNHLRRYGYHGLYHQAADMTRDQLGDNRQRRTVSLCLEPQLEVAAIIGHRPVMVTSGATPLEGLPGETTCGELDPTVILTLAGRRKWPVERINSVLTRDSGLRGLLGRSVSLGDVLTSQEWPEDNRLRPSADGMPCAARNILAYHSLLACGAGVAAMGGLDRIVLSGRYADQGSCLGRWLGKRLWPRSDHTPAPVLLECADTLSRILSDQAVAYGD